jgi:hypothetical protein
VFNLDDPAARPKVQITVKLKLFRDPLTNVGYVVSASNLFLVTSVPSVKAKILRGFIVGKRA